MVWKDALESNTQDSSLLFKEHIKASCTSLEVEATLPLPSPLDSLVHSCTSFYSVSTIPTLDSLQVLGTLVILGFGSSFLWFSTSTSFGWISSSWLYKSEEVDDSPDSLRRISSLRTKSWTSLNFNLLLPDELLIIVTIAFQLSGREDKSINAHTFSLKSIPTELNWVVTILSSLRCCPIDAPSIIHKLNNCLIKWTLFEVDGFSYMLERAIINSLL